MGFDLFAKRLIAGMQRVTETWRGRLFLVLTAYFTALFVCGVLTGYTRELWNEDALRIYFSILLGAAVFPGGFGYDKLGDLWLLSYVTYFGLSIALVASRRLFWRLFAAYAALLVANVYGCAFTSHRFT